MANSWIIRSRSLAVGDNTTRYHHPSGSGLAAHAAVARAEAPIRDAGVFSNLIVNAPSNTATVTSTVTLQVSQVDSALTVSYTSTQTGIKEDTSNTVTVAATDELDYEVTVPDTGPATTLTVAAVGVQFAPTTTTDCIALLVAGGDFNFTTASTSFFMSPNSRVNNPTTEANEKYRVRFSFTASDLFAYSYSNGRTTDVVVSTRKSGGAGAQSVTYTSGQTGTKEDTSNTDSLAAGDDFYYSVVTSTGTGGIQITTISCSCINTASLFPLLAGDPAPTAINFNVTTYFPVSGSLVTTSTTEANTQLYPRFTFTASELGAFVSANSIATSATTVTLMDNGSASALTVSYDAAQTGLKNDSSNTAEITTGSDEADYRIVTPNTSGSITFRWIGIVGSTAVAAVRRRFKVSG